MKDEIIINEVNVSECKKCMNCANGNMTTKEIKQEYRCTDDAKLCEKKPNCSFKEQARERR